MYRYIGAAVQILICVDRRLLRVFPIRGVAQRGILSLALLRIHLEALVAGAVGERCVRRSLRLRAARHAQNISTTLRMAIDGQTVRMISGHNQQRLVQLIPVFIIH